MLLHNLSEVLINTCHSQVAPGEVTLVTGVPNSGKSEWLDALIVNLAEEHGWRFALASMEKAPVHHVRQLVEKRLRKPFFGGAGYAQGVERMSQEVWRQGVKRASGDCYRMEVARPCRAKTELRCAGLAACQARRCATNATTAGTLPAARCSNLLRCV
jgi:hypothetical protein